MKTRRKALLATLLPALLLLLADARINSASGKRAEIIREYLGYIEQLRGGQAGRLQAAEGESVGAVRRRLGSAARMAGKDLVIRRKEHEIYFWTRSEAAKTAIRRGRPRKA